MAEAIVMAVGAYGVFGLLFALLFVTMGIERVDPLAKGSGIGFRLVVMPGAAALWPLLLARWVGGGAK